MKFYVRTLAFIKKKIHLEDQQHPQALAFRLVPLEHIREDRRKKNPSPTVAETKTTYQKFNQDEKAESYVTDEGTR